METPPDADLLWMQTPLSNACWEATPRTEGMTNACENIALPQTPFAGSNKQSELEMCN